DRLIEALATIAALLDRTINEVKLIDSDFQNRLVQSIHETESSIKQEAADHLKRALKEADIKTRSEVTQELEARLQAETDAAVQQVRTDTDAERRVLEAELKQAQREAAQFKSERDKATQERDKAAQERDKAAQEVQAQVSSQAAISAAAKDAAL